MINNLHYKYFYLTLSYQTNIHMKKHTYSDMVAQTEAIVLNPSNYTQSGKLRSTVQKKLSRKITRLVYLTQFETPDYIVEFSN